MVNIPHELVEQFARGNVVLFIGAGLSKGAGLPDWSSLVHELSTEIDINLVNVDYRDVAQYYENEYGRNRLIQKIREKLNTLNIKPTKVHEALINLPVPAIFTTNYDDILEQVLRNEKHSFNTIIGNVDASFWSSDKLQLVKLHGDLSQPDSIVITSEDYEGFTFHHVTLSRLLTTTLQTRTVLFLGYSLTDPDLRLILTQIQREVGKYARNLYSVQFDVPELTINELGRRGVKVINLKTNELNNNDILFNWLTQLIGLINLELHNLNHTPQLKTKEVIKLRLADEVIGLLKAMGYTISQFEQDHQSVHFLAEKQSEGTIIRRRLFCIEGSIGTGHVQSAIEESQKNDNLITWLITYRKGMITPQARMKCNSNEIVKVLSISDFYRKMLQFDTYLHHILDIYKRTEIPKHWVDLACEVPQYGKSQNLNNGKDTFECVENFLDAWIDTPGRNHVSILGDFGTGKTWLCNHYAAKLAKRYIEDCEHNRVPILISLKNYSKALSIKQLITDTLINDYGVPLIGGYKTFEHLNRHDSLVLIFDGFDEMQLKLDDRTTVENFEELAKVVLPDANCKVILTCRTTYFRSDLEERELLAGEGLQRIKLKNRPNFEIVHLLPFDNKRIKIALKLRVPKEWKQYFNQIQQTYDLPDLAHRPILLSMISSTLPKLIKHDQVSSAILYQIYTDEWIKKNIEEERTFLDVESKTYFMQELAWEMFLRQSLSIHYTDFPRRVQDYFKLSYKTEVDYFEHDIRSQSFLQRDQNGYYTFAHKSFLEFFIAQRIFADIVNNNENNFKEVQTTHETDQFIKDFIKHEMQYVNTLIQWMYKGDSSVLRVNSAGVLAKIGDSKITNEVIKALKLDKEIRHLYLCAILYRVLEIKWEAAIRLSTEENGENLPNLTLLPADQLKVVVDKFCLEIFNQRDGVARWFSVLLLFRLKDIAPQKIKKTLQEALFNENTPETISEIKKILNNKRKIK